MKNFTKQIILSAIMMLVLANVGWGQAILYEDFNYTIGQNVGGSTNTTGGPVNNWYTHSNSKVGTINVISGNLSFVGLQSPNGNSILLPGDNTNVPRDINRAFTSSTNAYMYYSVLINVTDNTQLTTTADYFMHFGATSGVTNTTFGGRLGIKSVNTGANYRLSIGNTSGGTGNPTYTDFNLDLNFGTTYLVVVKYDRSVSPTIASLWVNPSSLGGSEPTGQVTNSSGTSAYPSFASICLRNSANTPKATIDEIRVGTTWASVTPISAPSTQASGITFTPHAYDMTATWTNGNGFNRIVKICDGSTFTDPVDNTNYTANSVYSGSGEQVVYNGNSNTVNVTGLSPLTTYYFRVYEYNNSGATYLYKIGTATNNPNNGTTLDAAAASINVSNTSLTAFTTTLGNASSSQTYTVSAVNLRKVLTITAPTGFQIKEQGIGSYGTTLQYTPVSGSVSTKTIEVIYNPTSGVSHSGNIVHNSLGATDVNSAVSGTASATYYYSGTGSITDPTKWGIITNGSGIQPLDFTSNNQVFNIRNTSSYTLDADLTISGTGSKLVVGDGTNACNFTIPSGFAYIGTVDVAALSTLTLQNATIPTLGTLNATSTVSYEYTGSSNVQTNTYGNLILKNGTKVLPNTITTAIIGNLTFDNVILDAGSVSPFTTLTLSGDLTYSGTVTNPADANSMTLVCNKGATQTISGNGNTARFFRLTTTGSGTNVVLSASSGGTYLLLANATSGGLNLANGTNLTVNSNTVEFLSGGKGYFYPGTTGTLTCDGTSSLILNSSNNTPGTIYFASGSNLLYNLTINETGTSSFTFGNSVNVASTLTMTSGDINMGTNTLTLGSSTSIRGILNRTTGTIIGKFARWFDATTSVFRLFPVGTATQYRPVDLSFTVAPSVGGTITVEHVASNPGIINTTAIDDNGYSLDTYSQVGYWKINAGDGLSGGEYSLNMTMAGIVGVSDVSKLHIIKRSLSTDPWAVYGTHVDGTGTNTNPTCSRTGMSGFSEFGIASNALDNMLDAPLPVNLSSLSSTIINRNIKLNWITASEINNSGFEIERKTLEGSFAKIGFVSGHGTVNTPTNYSFEDRNLQTGKYKYRLKQIDNNGNFEYFALNGEVEIGVPKKFDLSQNYPNPFNPVTKINFDLPENGLVNLRLYDMLGREVANIVNNEFRTAGYYTVNFDASKLSSGIYFYRMNAGSFSGIKKMAVLK